MELGHVSAEEGFHQEGEAVNQFMIDPWLVSSFAAVNLGDTWHAIRSESSLELATLGRSN